MAHPSKPMKQSELDKRLRAVAKAEAKQRGWKSVGGMPYWQEGPLLFVLVLSASAKERFIFASLRFKWLALDNMLWRVLDEVADQVPIMPRLRNPAPSRHASAGN